MKHRYTDHAPQCDLDVVPHSSPGSGYSSRPATYHGILMYTGPTYSGWLDFQVLLYRTP